ncbi:hypothetical protein ES332_A10G248500v1 [Gossypium tomentosum]|uniref:NET domain-containing protein n=1 Tax=Gossypium tomentosum TaxID=34277 RepID=A0A5D2NZH7_GOSTO|nr:hypothetical protein ES332_A10G248500v1 [Gossypium tomentosum]
MSSITWILVWVSDTYMCPTWICSILYVSYMDMFNSLKFFHVFAGLCRVVISTSMSKHASDMGVEHRKMSTKDKRNLGAAIARLSTEDLNKALEIIAQSNPGLQAMAEEVEIDIDAQSESTLWRLNFFVKDVFEGCDKSTAGNNKKKWKKEICDAIAQTIKKKSKKPSS